MLTKGSDTSVMGKRGRSPFPRKHALASTETRKIPIYDKHTVSSSIYAQSHIKHPSVDSTKLVPQSRVVSPKSKFNEKKVTNSNTSPTGLTKTKDARKPDIVKEIFHGKKQTKQPTTKLFDDHNIATHDEDDKKPMDREDEDILKCEVESQDVGDAPICLREDQNMVEPNTCCEDSVTTFDERISIEHTATEQMSITNDSNEQHPDSEVDQEVDYEQGVEVESKDVEQDRSNGLGPHYEEPEPEEVKEVPKEEEERLEEVVAHRKKETVAHDYVIEETERWNKVKALVGAFEYLISLECNALENTYQHRYK